MQSRMKRYDKQDDVKLERSSKNTKLYEEVYDDIYRDTTYKNMEVIDTAKEINLNKLKDILDDSYDNRQYRTLNNYSLEDLDIKPKAATSRKKVYDINEIINQAKNKRTFIEEAKEKQKYMDYAERNAKYEKRYNELRKEEQELEELINTMVVAKKENTDDELDLLSDLKGNENTIVTTPIQADIDKTAEDITKTNTRATGKVDKTFYTDSNMFTKNDFEDFTGLSRQLNGKGKKKKVVLIIIILLLLAVLAYFVVTKLIIK